MQMLGADFVEGALVSALEHGPERLYPVGVGHVAHVFGNRVLYCLMLERHSLISAVIVGVDSGVGSGVLRDKPLQSDGIRIGNNLCCYLIAVAVLHSNHGCFTCRSTSGASQLFTLGLAQVLALAAKVGLIHLNRAVEGAAGIGRPRLADAVQHEPSCGLRNAYIAGQLHTGDALKAGKAQVDGDGPFAERDVGPRNCRAGADAEIGAAIRAPVGHRLSVRDFLCPRAATLPAVALAAPEHVLEPLGGRFLGREHVHQLNDGDAFAVRFAGCLFGHFHSPCHDGDMVTGNTNVK